MDLSMSDEVVPISDMPDDHLSGQEVPPEDLHQPGDEVPTADLPEEALAQYSTPGQEALTGLEGLGRGATFGLSDALAKGMRSGATALGISPENLHYIAPAPEDIAGREEANPIISGASGLAGNVMGAKYLPKVGSSAINGMIQAGAMAGGDELSKAMLATGDPTPAVASHIVETGGAGLLLGGVFGKAEKLGTKGLSALEDAKIGNRLTSFLAGVGHSASFGAESGTPTEVNALKQMAVIPEDLHLPSFKAGQNFYDTMAGKAAAKTVKYIADIASLKSGNIPDLIKTHIMGTAAETVFNKVFPKIAKKTIGPVFIKLAGSNTVDGLSAAMDHATSCSQGAQKISRGVESLFDASSNKAIEYINSERDREKLKDFIDNGGVEAQTEQQASQNPSHPNGYAEGGEVTPNPPLQTSSPLSQIWPEQNVMLNAAKGRISRFLSSIKPSQNPNKLPYDSEHKSPQKEHEYNQMLDLANQPLTILNKVKDGSLSIAHAGAFKSMHPELHQVLSQKIREHIIQRHVDEEKRPPYHMRQAMSLFLGQNLESTLTPANIQAAQNSFVMQKAQQAQGNAAPNSKAELSKIGQNAQTNDQARQQRQTKS